MALLTSNLNAFLTPLILIKSSLIGFVHNFFTHSKTLSQKHGNQFFAWILMYLQIKLYRCTINVMFFLFRQIFLKNLLTKRCPVCIIDTVVENKIICECAGTGRQARLRGVCFTTYGFKSRHSQQRRKRMRYTHPLFHLTDKEQKGT